jgi:methylphosphotriester-DNA--protein-cysteine methyltransferase
MTQQERGKTIPIESAMTILRKNTCEIVTVQHWTQAVGYECAKRFSDAFRNEFGKRPQPVLIAHRTHRAIELLWDGELSNYEIARKLKLRNEKGLYQFVKQHTDHLPTEIKNLSLNKHRKLQERLTNNII